MGPGCPIGELDAPASRHPGLYAVYGERATWAELGLGVPPDDRPLYVGKAEMSLAARDVASHFGRKPRGVQSPTGSSTLRRSLAALLSSDHGFIGIPRNPAKPGHFSSFGLSEIDDDALSRWMEDRLRLSIWPHLVVKQLDGIETEVLRRLQPPLNLTKVTTPWTASTKALRKKLAIQAEEWRPA